MVRLDGTFQDDVTKGFSKGFSIFKNTIFGRLKVLGLEIGTLKGLFNLRFLQVCVRYEVVSILASKMRISPLTEMNA